MRFLQLSYFFSSEFCPLGPYTCCETVEGINCIITCGGQSVLEELDNTTLSRHSILREIVQEKSKRSFYGSHSYYHQCGWQNVKLFPDQYKFRTEAWQTDNSIYSLKATIELTFIVNLSPTHWNHRPIQGLQQILFGFSLEQRLYTLFTFLS